METAGASLSWRMRWTCEASKSNVSPARVAAAGAAAPPSTRRSSTSSPSTTATAPLETSWSWKPVSLPFVHEITHTSTWSSRHSCSKWRSGVPWRTSAAPRSGSAAIAGDQIAQLGAVEVAAHAGDLHGRAAPSSRAGLRSRSAARTASPSAQLAGRDDGPVGAEDELVDADLAHHRVDGAVAVGGDVEEDAGVADRRGRRGPSAARGAAARGRRASRSTRAGPDAPAGPRRRTRTRPRCIAAT